MSDENAIHRLVKQKSGGQTQEGIDEAFLAKGLRADEIVVAWQPEYKRQLTGFAVG